MRLWRISVFIDLSGRGGLLASGRWHQAGRAVVYLAESPAAAMLEVLVHLEIDAEDIPDNLRLLRVDMPDNVSIRQASPLPEQWEEHVEQTRTLGGSWLAEGSSLLLAVPSAIMPHTTNYLFNPLHPEADQANVSVESLKLGRRLLKGL